MPRISRDEMFVEVAKLIALRSTCTRGQVGALIVVYKHIVSMGYNGAPPGQPHCFDVGCDMEKVNKAVFPEPDLWVEVGGCRRATHAELNAVAFAARQGIPCVNGTMYSTHATCVQCARAVVAAGIRKVVYVYPYRLTEGIELLDKCNVEVISYGGS